MRMIVMKFGGSSLKDADCTTAIAAIPLWKLHQAYGLKKVFISTYQSTSGAGAKGMQELETETQNYLDGKPASHGAFQHPIAFNVIPHIDSFQENGYTREEMKVVGETRKIFGDPNIPISCTCVRVPTFRAHAEGIVVETRKPVSPDGVRELFSNTPGIVVRDDPANNVYPMPLTASNNYSVEVGRIRRNLVFGDHGIEFFVCGDQLLKGATLNAVQIAEALIEKGVFQ
ncbi:MAG: aspartate-semialdehyde dehydrogenase [Candidatus Diapherotrites archaeon]|nr:aspartate-semialdehyde dehydrogenase [Candidatus Diapherotrites archaeon]